MYSKFKLTADVRKAMQRALDDFMYTCGAQLQGLGLEGQNETLRCCNEPDSVGTYEKIIVSTAAQV